VTRAQGWRKGTPIHVRGAFVYNQMIKEHKMQNRLTPLRDGDKIRFSYLTLPNPARENVIASMDEMPKEFGLDEYIDREMQFSKSFEDP
jgi:hypothetical protein